MAKLNLKSPLRLMEDFMAGEISKPQDTTAPAVKTDSKTISLDKKSQGEKVRAEIVKDVDTILTNLEQLSKQITESADGLILEEEMIAKLFASMKSGLAIAKCEGQFKNYEKMLLLADANMQAAKTAKEMKDLKDAIKAKKDKLSGSKLEVFNAKAEKQQAKFEAQAEYEKERNKNALSEFEAELTEEEANISKDSVLGKLYFRKKQMLKNQVAEQGVETNAQIQMVLKNDATAEKLAEKLKDLQDKQNQLAKDIASGEKDGGDDLKELEGIKAYIKEIEAIQKASSASAKIAEEAKKEAVGISESFYSTWASENVALLEGAVADLFSKAKGANDEAALAKAKSLAGKLKVAADAEYKAKVALVNKIKGKEVPKTIVILAGGDGDSAKEGENGYTLGEFIPKWGGGSEFVKPEEFGPMKDVTEVEANIEDAIAAAKEANKEGETETDTLTDEQKGKIADMEKDISKTQELLSQAQNPEDGSEPDAGKITGLQDTLKKKEDKLKDMQAGKFESAGTVDGESLNEGLHPKLKKAMKAVNKGETVYGENVRFPGRFKIIEMGELFATVDYEDGTDPMEMASMNIKIDSLQFESVEIEEGNEFGAARAEAIAKGEKTFKVGDEEYPVEDVSKDDKENAKEFVEEAKKELPKKIKLYEGMSVADKFKALM